MRRDVDEAIAAVAAAQHGVFSVGQAAAAGADSRLRARRVAAGTWERIGPKVLVLAGSRRTWRRDVMAATLEGAGSAASHLSAAPLLGIPGFAERGMPHVQRVRGPSHEHVLATLHETFWLPPHHLTVIDGIPCTSLARTVFDLASCIHPGKVERALDNSLARLGLDVGRIAEVLAAVGRSGKPGTTLIRELVSVRSEGYIPPASELEALLVAVVASHGLPQPVRQVDLGDHEWVGRLDFLYRAEKVILETDGRPYHTALRDRETDEARRARLEADGWLVVVLTWRQLTSEPEQCARRIRNALRRAAAA